MAGMAREAAVLVLENGARFQGSLFGAEVAGVGEICFNTSMSGYQEILTDPSYCKQIITFTYPMIGNYGVHERFMESGRVQAAGCVVKEYVNGYSNHSAAGSLHEFLVASNVPGIEGLDTRQLVLAIRNQGAMRAGIFPGEFQEALLEEVCAFPGMEGLDLASLVSTKSPYNWGEHSSEKINLACLDFGVKKSILTLLDQAGFNVFVFPGRTSVDQLLSFPACFLSNGPGDPAALPWAVEAVRILIEQKKYIFGICLGHQILGLALGRDTYKLKFGHRGGNQPVQDLASGRVEITSQNHGFAVRYDEGFPLSHINLNDRTTEGFRRERILSVQYHPEASPGPHDSRYLFSEFYQMVAPSVLASV